MLAQERLAKKFFYAQARQETRHARLFLIGADWIAPKIAVRPHDFHGFHQFLNRVQQAIGQHQLSESVLALQILLEALGEFVLERIDTNMTRRGFGLTQIRNIVRKQEIAHHAFGYHFLTRDMRLHPQQNCHLRTACQDYLSIIDTILGDAKPLLEYFHQDSNDYMQHILNAIPHNIRYPK